MIIPSRVDKLKISIGVSHHCIVDGTSPPLLACDSTVAGLTHTGTIGHVTVTTAREIGDTYRVGGVVQLDAFELGTT